MSEAALIGRTPEPLTARSLAERLRACGLAAGQTVIVHMAMSKLGWVIGGAEAVILALLDVLSPEGTLVMPAHTSGNSDPAMWQHPPVPQAWWQLVRDHMPPFNPATTPTRQMGAVAELFRTWPGALRSDHPTSSFAALGRHAEHVTAGHMLEEDLGERSPLGRLYDLDGYVLLLGVTHENNTSLHLAEYRAAYPGKQTLRTGSSALVDGAQRWIEYEVLDVNTDDFERIGQEFEQAQGVEIQRIADAEVRLFRQRDLVDFAVGWMAQHRNLQKEEPNAP